LIADKLLQFINDKTYSSEKGPNNNDKNKNNKNPFNSQIFVSLLFARLNKERAINEILN
jgi:hypothetical protein